MTIQHYFTACIFATLLSAPEISSIKTLNGSTGLKQIVESEFEQFRPVAEVLNVKLGNIVYTDAPSSHVINDDPDMAINLKEIANYTTDSSEAFTRTFCKFVIAHELGHKIQFGGYRRDVINKRTGEGTIFLECHADVLAGLIMNQVYNTVEVPQLKARTPGFDPNVYAQNMGPVIFSVYNTIFRMDSRNSTIKTHPSNDQRLEAIQHGVLAAGCYYYHFMLTNNTAAALNISEAEYGRIKSLYIGFGKALAYNPYDANNDNPLSWAHAEAIRIIHENNSLARNLVRYDERINWNTSADNPIVRFSFHILNNNPGNVRFSGRVVSEIMPRAGIANDVRIGPVDALPFDQNIPPGGDIEISGTLAWVADNKYMPHLLIPGDPRSLYWVFDRDVPVPDYGEVNQFKADFSDWDDDSPNEVDDLVKYVVSIKDHLLNYADGMGVSTRHAAVDIPKGRITYEPSFVSGDRTAHQIYARQDKNEVTYQCTILSSPNKTVAEARFNQIATKLGRSYPNSSEPDSLDSMKWQTFNDESGHKAVRVNLDYGTGEDPNTVTIQIFGK